MGRLIVLDRNQIQIVSGRVIDIAKDKITIEDEVILKDKTKVNKKITLIYNKAANLKLKKGAVIIASVRANNELSALAKGINNSKDIAVNAYVVRYTGNFDFEAYKNIKETHVFCANISKITEIKSGSLISISLNSEQKTLFTSAAVKGKLSKKSIFVTGAPQISSVGIVYKCKSIITV